MKTVWLNVIYMTLWYCCWSTGKIRIDGLITTTLMCSSRICEFRLGQLHHCDQESIISFGNSKFAQWPKFLKFVHLLWGLFTFLNHQKSDSIKCKFCPNTSTMDMRVPLGPAWISLWSRINNLIWKLNYWQWPEFLDFLHVLWNIFAF